MTSTIDLDTKAMSYDTTRLDRLMDEAGIDALLVCSRHNLRYLLNGYSFFFFERFEAFADSRHFPILLYFRGRPEEAVYIGNSMEAFEREGGRFWMNEVHTRSWGVRDAVGAAAQYLAQRPGIGALGIEPSFLPVLARDMLADALPDLRLVDGQRTLELLRAIKTPTQLDYVRKASDDVVDAMLAAMAAHGPGSTRREIVATLEREEVRRGLSFEYCLISSGSSLNRSPNDTTVREGDIVSIDSGGHYRGYIGDLCRMAIAGEPDQELVDLLAEVDAIQAAARAKVAEGVIASEIYTAARDRISRGSNASLVDFTAHGVGTVTHETPRIDPHGTFAYEAVDARTPLERGMVVSVETAIKHPRRGFIKLEDTLAITERGTEAYGDVGRGWNRLG